MKPVNYVGIANADKAAGIRWKMIPLQSANNNLVAEICNAYASAGYTINLEGIKSIQRTYPPSLVWFEHHGILLVTLNNNGKDS